jgi:hypothetical protein
VTSLVVTMEVDDAAKALWQQDVPSGSSLRDSVKRLKLLSQKLKQQQKQEEEQRVVFLAAETIFYANYDQERTKGADKTEFIPS